MLFVLLKNKKFYLVVKFLALGISQQDWPINGPLPHSKPCKICNTECYLSTVVCRCSVDYFACLDHAIEISF